MDKVLDIKSFWMAARYIKIGVIWMGSDEVRENTVFQLPENNVLSSQEKYMLQYRIAKVNTKLIYKIL